MIVSANGVFTPSLRATMAGAHMGRSRWMIEVSCRPCSAIGMLRMQATSKSSMKSTARTPCLIIRIGRADPRSTKHSKKPFPAAKQEAVHGPANYRWR